MIELLHGKKLFYVNRSEQTLLCCLDEACNDKSTED